MLNISYNCSCCRSKVTQQAYTYNIKIINRANFYESSEEYTLSASVKSICPYCGHMHEETIRKYLSQSDLIKILQEQIDK